MEGLKKQNPLGSEPVGVLMRKFAIPSIVAMVVSALYNIVDQLFIGQAVGMMGNAATNIAFPLTTSCVALALLFGTGGASCFNLAMGHGDWERAVYYIGNAAVMLFSSGLLLCLFVQIFLTPLLKGFGAPADVLPYAGAYVRITSIGFPFLILTTGGCHLIRADGSPRMSMLCNVTGAVINTALDAVFVLRMGWGMQGAAWATAIGQFVSAAIVFLCLRHYKTVPLGVRHLRIRWEYAKNIVAIGMASFFNQIAMMVVQIVMNNSLSYYGALSVYGEAVPLACAGIVIKVNQLFFSVVIGLGQASQPIISFNYGAGQYRRVRMTYRYAAVTGMFIAILAFVIFQAFPRQILLLFGSNTEEYFSFGVMFFRIYLFCAWLNFLQPMTSTFFTSIGKPVKGIFLSLTRQLLFLLPLIVILPIFLGLTGILFAGPIADALAAVASFGLAAAEFRLMRRMENTG
ncbi:MAG: MATE family efflux transporter [Clostridiales bacterium]|nr:MATE family efflux transporter [Clostridiales bacterium]